MTTYDNEQLIQAYLRMVDEDDYAAVGSILTEDATWTIVPIGYTWTGRRAIESMAVAAGSKWRHDQRSHIEIKNWFTDGEHVCVEYTHKLVVRGLGWRLTVDGYCLVFHMRDGRFDAIPNPQPAQHRGGARDVSLAAAAALSEQEAAGAIVTSTTDRQGPQPSSEKHASAAPCSRSTRKCWRASTNLRLICWHAANARSPRIGEAKSKGSNSR